MSLALERYLQLEQQLMRLDDNGEELGAEALRYWMDYIWNSRLSESERQELNSRGAMTPDPTVEDLVELPRRVVKQPTPELSPGGDCGACVLAGLLKMTPEDVYAKLHPKGVAQHFTRRDMACALQTACCSLELLDRYIVQTPHWPQCDDMRAWGDACWVQSMQWREWITMALDAGYYAIAQVAAAPVQTVSESAFMTDHWVLYCGTRTKWDGPPGARKTGIYELLVSDSGRSKPLEKWCDIGDHLMGRGGFAALLARPARKAKP